MTICDAILSAVFGVGTGALSSWMVGRYFRKAAMLDAVLTRLKACSPFLQKDQNPGDGLTNTSHELHILSEILQIGGFAPAAKEVKAISDAMKILQPVPHPWPEPEATERPRIKEQWESRITKLYNCF